jgi:uncharacterized protein
MARRGGVMRRQGRTASGILAVLVALPCLAAAEEPAAKTEPPKPEVEVSWGVKVPMRDGVELNATVYRPEGHPTRLPVVFTLTPYVADSYHDRALYFAQNGYVFALVDARGRGNSQGRFQPIAKEARDGHDIVEWLARQPWSNGKIGMWGGSYAGYDQWATLKQFPPHLATIVPAAAAYPGVDFPMQKNIFYPYDIQWLTLTSGVTPNSKLFGEASFWIGRFRELYLRHLPFADLDRVAGNLSTDFQEWLKHPTPDAFWESMTPSSDEYSRMSIPILTITGHYDADQRGAMEFYRLHMRHAPADARAKHYLILGPWDHAGTRTPSKEFGGLTFGEAAILDLNGLHKEWYDWTLKGGKRPKFLKNRVACYVAGAEEWKYAGSLEAITGGKRTLYLGSEGGRAGDVFHSGTLSETAPMKESPPDAYVYDPLDVRPADLEREEVKDYLTDQRYQLNLFGNGLVYHSEPFAEAVEVTGSVRLVVWIAMDVPDTDFYVTLHEILADGSAVALTDDSLRARYRLSLKDETLVVPGEINRYEFDTFQIFSRRLAKGSRLRLVLGCPNSIYWQKNYNSGGVVARESGKDARTAHVRLYHDAAYPSFLEIPVGR